MADEQKPDEGKALLMKVATSLITFAVGALVALVANYLGVKAPDVITIPVTVQAAPAPASVDGADMFEARPRLLGLRAKIRAEVERRAALPVDNPWHITADKAAEVNAFVGKLGDGHLLELLIRYGPDIVALVIKILGLLAVL